MDDKVSIIIPLYNYEKYVSDCIASCRLQTHENIEMIFIDDCSTDKSKEEVQKFAKIDKRIILLKHFENRGYSSAKNTGIRHSSGKYIVHLDADDMLTTESIEIRLNHLLKNPNVMMVHGRAYDVKNDIAYYECTRNHSKFGETKAQIHAQGVMLKRECYEKYGLYEERLRSKSDKEMWIRLRDIAKINIEKIDEFVAYYRIHGKSMMAMRRTNKQYDSDVIKIFNEVTSIRKKEGITHKNTLFM
ncbi:MAG: glycosyltransferase family 2 protein [Acholeplasmataceae bacterium]